MAAVPALRPVAIALIALAAARASARVIEFPIQLDHAFVRQRMIETLFDAEGESRRVWRDASQCNDVVLAHPRLSERDGKLRVVADFDAKLGAPMGSWCFNATRRKGILDAALEARLHPNVPIVEFRVANSELLDSDGQKRLTGALWDWVRAQVQPHLETMRIDLYQPMTELKTFLPVLFPGSDLARVKKLIESLALTDAVVSAQGLTLRVRLDVPDPEHPRAPGGAEPALTPEEIARWDSAWQSWDGFLTFLVKHSSKDAGDASRDQLRALLLDARQDVTDILASTEPHPGDPVPPLFLKTWTRLAPILRQISTPLPGDTALRYLSLIAAADAFTALEQLGPDYGVELTTDGLRRMARMLVPSPLSDPTAYSESVDSELRGVFGFGPPLSEPEPEEATEDETAAPGAMERSAPPAPAEPPQPQSSLPPAPRFAILLVAGNAPRSLDHWIPTREDLLDYLPRVGDLLGATALRTQRKKVLPGQHSKLFRNLVLATAWQESCWRQFVRKGAAVKPLTSSVGAIGIMQVNPHVWRGFYDLKSLRTSTKYNAEAGSEILYHYLVEYAIKNHEDLARKNADDLARATYAAYNAGPHQLDRYRRAFAKGQTGHRIDADFWEKYQQIANGKDLAVQACFAGSAT